MPAKKKPTKAPKVMPFLDGLLNDLSEKFSVYQRELDFDGTLITWQITAETDYNNDPVIAANPIWDIEYRDKKSQHRHWHYDCEEFIESELSDFTSGCGPYLEPARLLTQLQKWTKEYQKTTCQTCKRPLQ